MHIVELMYFLKWPLFMNKLATNAIGTRNLKIIVELSAILRFILGVDRCCRHVHLKIPMSELAFIAISAKLAIRLNPVLAHLCLELSFITLLIIILNCFPLLLIMPAPFATPSGPSLLWPTIWLSSLLIFTLLYQHSRWVWCDISLQVMSLFDQVVHQISVLWDKA